MDLLTIVWVSTEIFFVLSILFLIILVIARIASSYRVTFTSDSVKEYQLGIKRGMEVPKKYKDFMAFCYALGMMLEGDIDSEDKVYLTEYIMKYNILERLTKSYDNAYLEPQKIYYLLLITFMRKESSRNIYRDILENMQKSKQKIEFKILALYGLASVCYKSEDMIEIYSYLKSIDSKKFTSQKMSQFFFTLALKNMSSEEITKFIYYMDCHDIENMIVFCAFLYAMPSIDVDETLVHSIKHLQHSIPDDTMLLVATIRSIYQSGGNIHDLILKYHDDSRDVLRIVCSKIAIDVMPLSCTYLFVPYLCDENNYVKENIIEAFIKHDLKAKDILSILDEKKSDFCRIKFIYEMNKIEKTKGS